MLGYWFLIQLLGGLPTLGDERGGVAFWAHAGGFVAGAVLILVFKDPSWWPGTGAGAAMSEGWPRRRRAVRRGPGVLIDEARGVVERWTAMPQGRLDGVPPWPASAGEEPGIGRFIQHTLLKPEAGNDAITAHCEEAIRYGVYAVCVNGVWVADCAARLARTGVVVTAVVGFPMGAGASKAKAAEAKLGGRLGRGGAGHGDGDRAGKIRGVALRRRRHSPGGRCRGPCPGDGGARDRGA